MYKTGESFLYGAFIHRRDCYKGSRRIHTFIAVSFERAISTVFGSYLELVEIWIQNDGENSHIALVYAVMREKRASHIALQSVKF